MALKRGDFRRLQPATHIIEPVVHFNILKYPRNPSFWSSQLCLALNVSTPAKRRPDDRAIVASHGTGDTDSDLEDGVPEVEPIYIADDLEELIVIDGRNVGGVICT